MGRWDRINLLPSHPSRDTKHQEAGRIKDKERQTYVQREGKTFIRTQQRNMHNIPMSIWAVGLSVMNLGLESGGHGCAASHSAVDFTLPGCYSLSLSHSQDRTTMHIHPHLLPSFLGALAAVSLKRAPVL